MPKRTTRTAGAVKVRITEDRMGGLTVELWSEKLCKAWTERAHDKGRTIREGAYLQSHDEIATFMEEITPAARRDLKAGYPAACFINDERAMCLFNVSY